MSLENTTPVKITPEIENFCKNDIRIDGNPVYVDVLPEEGYEFGDCFGNVNKHIEKHSGSIQYGWQIWEIPNVWLEAEFHAVWIDNNGNFIDVTPKEDGEIKILFLPDSIRKYTGIPVDNIRKRLIKNEYTYNLVENGIRNYIEKLRNTTIIEF